MKRHASMMPGGGGGAQVPIRTRKRPCCAGYTAGPGDPVYCIPNSAAERYAVVILPPAPGLALRRFGATVALAATSQVTEGPLFVFDYLLRIARVAVLLSLWRVLLRGQGSVSGLTLQAVLTYTLIAEVFAEQLAGRAGIEQALWEGTIVTRMLQPMSLVAQFLADLCGRWCWGWVLLSLPLVICSPLLGVNPAPAGPVAAAAFALSLVLGVSVGLALDFVFAGLIVAMEGGIWLVDRVRNALSAMLSGALVPLALLPWGLGGIFGWLPFAQLASTPLRLYTGTGPPAQLLATQAAWSLALWPLAAWVWRANRERLAGYGG